MTSISPLDKPPSVDDPINVQKPAKRASSEDQQKDDGDRPAKRRRTTKTATSASKKKSAKMRRQDDDEDEEYGDPAGDGDDTDSDQSDEEEEPVKETKKHIHPCICDLDIRRRAKIEQFLKRKQIQQTKYEKRVKEIEDELERLEEERLARERELQEQQELFGDEYEVVGKKKKRKKRSARRASMVSLGVKQVINWKKQPKHPVKHNAVSNLRKEFTVYCGRSDCPESPPLPVDFRKEPDVPVRETQSFKIRMQMNMKLKKFLIDSEDKRPRFVTPYYV